MPADPEQARVEVELDELTETEDGVRVHVRPVGEIAVAKATVPANPSRLVMVIVEVPLALARSVTLGGAAEMVKSWTV